MKAKRLFYSVTFYLLLMFLLVLWKPSLMFNNDGSVKPYGLEKGETMFSFGVACVVLAIASFYIFAFIDMLFD